ncbi:GNAT family N-acetyltransferase [Shimia abyssi]|uniref:Acetyltransferase (GNAT) family protein n=1 Tax=Shimia abyssi TaxID=1662395 RepID=A0A2P8FFN9_9RHOB|nr:GNAT family N-acetyltransferase [Shimia abyssi]PSL20536.1 acetyltransferase (GNAT) family protein [Shimia abyssi]
MAFQIRTVTRDQELKVFERVAFEVYRNDPNWVPPLPGTVRGQLGPESKFIKYGRFQAFWAEDVKGRLLGRIVASVNDRLNEKEGQVIGSFGYFECINDSGVSDSLFDAATAWLIEQGCEVARGPIDLVTHVGGLTLVEGFDTPPMFRMPYNPDYYPALIERAGWRRARDAFAFDYPMEPLRRVFERSYEAAKKAGITFRSVHTKGEAMRRDLRSIHRIFSESFEENWSATERDAAEFVDEAAQMRHIIDRRIFPVAELNGEMVGFWMGLPNINAALIRSKGWPAPLVYAHLLWQRRKLDTARVLVVAVLPEFQKQHYGVALSLIYLGMTGGASGRLPYRRAELSWVWENNKSSLGLIRASGGQQYKTYRMYERALTPKKP